MSNPFGTRLVLWALFGASAFLVRSATASDLTLFAEAEADAPLAAVSPGKPVQPSATWAAREWNGASGGKVLSFSGSPLTESPGMVFAIPVAGKYRVWLRYFKKTQAPVHLYAVMRDDSTEVIAFAYLDPVRSRVPSETPYLETASPTNAKSGFVWESFEAVFERPMKALLCVGGGAGERVIDCALVTTNSGLDPSSMEIGEVAHLATADIASAPPLSLPGFVLSHGLPVSIDAFAGVEDPKRRFWAGIINNGSIFTDGARMIQMGFNRDHSSPSWRWGIKSMVPMESFNDPTFNKAHPVPEGRFVNAKGEVSHSFSLHYQPWVDASIADLKQKVSNLVATEDGHIGFWRISAEEGGWLDYSPVAQEAFRQWLQERHGDIATLNRRWGSHYSGFDVIKPAATYEEDHASYLEFREFSGHAYAVSVGRRIPIIQALDPQHRPCLGANSNLDIAAPFFMAFRPNDFEELIRVGLKDEKYVAFDIYCADDDMGNSIDFLTSLAQGRKLLNQEFSNHVVDPRIAARTYWEQVAKGVHGINLFMFQGNSAHPTYPKWGLTGEDGSPKQKLAAYSDAVQEVHRLEPLLMSATYTHAVKPVALYWSRIDLGLDVPHDSWYGHPLNSPIHVYEALRASGYAVRWITPRQIAEGELEQVGALVMPGCNHVPQVAAQKIESWVKSGGAVIGDSWPGAFDEYGQPQATLAPLFGVRPAPRKGSSKPGSQLALQESRQGYGEVTEAAALRQDYTQKVEEMAQQPGATHPVARAMGDFMLTGIGPEPVQCVAGKVVAMMHTGTPGFVANDYGQGKTLYSAVLLGTVYESAPTAYEWDTTHSGLSYPHLLSAFLRYAGVSPSSEVLGLAPRVAAKLRVESPLVTPEGNILVGLTSLNDDVVKSFRLKVKLPHGSGPFANVLAAIGGGRSLESLKYELEGDTLTVQMPEFDTYATLLALKEAAPLVGLTLRGGLVHGPALLAMVPPRAVFSIEAVVHNPSSHPLDAGTLHFTAPEGWLQSAQEVPVGPIPAGGEAHVSFHVKAPALAGPCRLRPLQVRFTNGSTQSTPATEMVWWKSR